ncbi:MAG: toll/interleukin-1 receptor domain-containing protein [Mycobacterium sp.]|uniref:toll/interleukin-1 receptor domain-containing protein n=1 Tax=Mycobacterium sp. TaxID=1785 RepID=UPI003F987D6A
MPATVFVSYVPTDRQIALEITHALRGRDFRVFFDVEDLRAGERWENITKLLRILTN